MRRCAIYTRKSTEERLDMRYNSLDAQRDACLSYVASQTHADWVAIPTILDDGGHSGGSLDRPALLELMRLVEAGQVDVVLVHKVDRLSRSLIDFAKLVDHFDKHGVSFVSVTQNLDTSTSMGRLNLNVLLSFAQFEREIASERIREKIAASRRKGLWTGGCRPLGYDIIDKALFPNSNEAQLVCHIFDRYARLKSVALLKDELSKNFPVGRRFSRGSLYTILKNPIYVGKLRLGHELIDAVHTPILSYETWENCQTLLNDNRRRGRRGAVDRSTPLLLGKLVNTNGIKFTRTHTVRHGKIYSYYISIADEKLRRRIRSDVLDLQIAGHVRSELRKDSWKIDYIDLISNRPDIVEKILSCPTSELNDSKILSAIETVALSAGQALIRYRVDWLIASLINEAGVLPAHLRKIQLRLPNRSRRRPIKTPSVSISTDEEWVSHGRRWFTMLANGVHETQAELARAEAVSQSTVSRAIDRALTIR